jgi:hypothetical protein
LVFPLAHWVEVLLQLLNPYFFKISKHYLEPIKLAIMKTKWLKILKNLKIW